LAQINEPVDEKPQAKALPTEERHSIGFEGVLATYGHGMSFYYRRAVSPYTSVFGETDILNVPKRDPVSPYLHIYQGPKNPDIVLVTVFGGIRREICTDMFPRNFRPFLGVGGGPVLAFEDLYLREFRFRNRFPYMSAYLHAQTHLTGGGYLGAGFVTGLSEKWTTEFEVRYNVIYFDHEVSGERNYSGFYVSLGIARIF
jgi:hypothetical protein